MQFLTEGIQKNTMAKNKLKRKFSFSFDFSQLDFLGERAHFCALTLLLE